MNPPDDLYAIAAVAGIFLMILIVEGYMDNEQLRRLWRDAGGSFHGPNVETGTMSESELLPFLRSLLAGEVARVDSSTVPMPVTADQAQGMAIIGIHWLRENAPDRLKRVPAASPQVPDATLRVIEAARCIQHWHDRGDAMIVSGDAVRALWVALGEYDAAAPQPGES